MAVTRKRDGDGDGFVDDGTPMERPVIPGFDLDVNGDPVRPKRPKGGNPQKVADTVAVKRNRVGNVDSDRLRRRRERLIGEIDDSSVFYPSGRHGFAMRAAELTVIESELERRGELARKDRFTATILADPNPFTEELPGGEAGSVATTVEMDDTFRKVVAQRGSRVDAEQLQEAWAVAVSDPDDLDAIRAALPADAVRSWQQTYGADAVAAMRRGMGGVPPLEELLAHNARRLTETVPLTRDNLGVNGMPSAAEIVEHDFDMALWLGIDGSTPYGKLRVPIGRRALANLLSDPDPPEEGVRYLQMLRRAAERDIERMGGSVTLHRANTQGTDSVFDTRGGSGITSWTTDYATAAKYAKGPATVASVDVPGDRVLAYDTFGMMASTGFWDFAGQDSYPLPGREVLVTSPQVIERLDAGVFPLLLSAAAGEAPAAPVVAAVDGDGDGFVHDGTPRMRPVGPQDIGAVKGGRKRKRPPVEADDAADVEDTFEQGRGDCFPAAFYAAQQLEAEGKANVRVVHGRPIYQGDGPGEAADGRFWHAWAEYDQTFPGTDHKLRMVVDRSNDGNVELPDGLYYGVAGVNDGSMWSDWSDQPPVKRYTLDEARREALKAEHWGPWGEDDPNRRNPFTEELPGGEAEGVVGGSGGWVPDPSAVEFREFRSAESRDDPWWKNRVPVVPRPIVEWVAAGGMRHEEMRAVRGHGGTATAAKRAKKAADSILAKLDSPAASPLDRIPLTKDYVALWDELALSVYSRQMLSRALHDGPTPEEREFFRFVHEAYLARLEFDDHTPADVQGIFRATTYGVDDPFDPDPGWKKKAIRPKAKGSGVTSWYAAGKPFGHPVGRPSDHNPNDDGSYLDWAGDVPFHQVLGRFGDTDHEVIVGRPGVIEDLLGYDSEFLAEVDGDPLNPFAETVGDPDVVLGSGRGSPAPYPGMRPVTPDERKALRVEGQPIPPAWTDVYVAEDPGADMLARGLDRKGRHVYVYSAAHDRRKAAAKYERTKAVAARVGALDAALERDAMDDPTAAATMLIRHFGLRPGSTADTKARKKAYGATTLQARHVRQYPETLRTTLSFVGKSGQKITVSTRDPRIYNLMERWTAGKEGTTPLFDTSDGLVLLYVKQHLGEEFLTKDLRTLLANTMALDMVSSMRRPTTLAKFKAARNRIADAVSKALGNTRQVTLSNYIDPTVFAPWEGALPA